MIKESGSLLIHFQKLRLEHWAEHFREQFNCPTVTGDLPLMTVTEPIQADTSPPSESKAIREVGLQKSHKAAELDGLLLPFFEDDSGLKSKLARLGINLGKKTEFLRLM